ncbi:MAG TPA: DUF3558 family protein [Pseudonocardia sp.]|nr:DUF3558 family protein [Pseudonocardia sp.]
MTTRLPGWLTIAFGTTLLIGLAGCDTPPNVSEQSDASAPSAASSAPSTAALPPRPAELKLNGVKPCDLLTVTDEAKLGVGAGAVNDGADTWSSEGCRWSDPSGHPDNNWVALAVVRQGADAALRSSTGAQVGLVDGFPAVQTNSDSADPGLSCKILLDVAPGQTLSVEYVNRRGDYPNINHGIACQQATDATKLMLANLRKKAPAN